MARRRRNSEEAAEDGTGKRLVGYVRVSTQDQVHGQSPEGQRKAIEAYCLFHKHTLVEILTDDGISGRRSIFKREAAARAMEMVSRGKADGVIVWKLDRLGRDANELVQVAKRFHKNDWHLMSVTEQLDSTNFMGRFFIHIMAAMAEMESGRIGERVEMGMAQLVTASRARSPKTPFGWRMPDGKWRPKVRKRDDDGKKAGPADKRTLVEHPEEQAVLAKIMKLAAKGSTPYAIAKALTAQGVVHPRTKKKVWFPNLIVSILDTQKRHDRIHRSRAGIGATA